MTHRLSTLDFYCATLTAAGLIGLWLSDTPGQVAAAGLTVCIALAVALLASD